MANQDVLFPFLPRNTRVDLSERNLRVKRIQSIARAAQVVADEENQAAHQLAEPAPVAEDPRRKNPTQDDDRYKGVHLDTFV